MDWDSEASAIDDHGREIPVEVLPPSAFQQDAYLLVVPSPGPREVVDSEAESKRLLLAVLIAIFAGVVLLIGLLLGYEMGLRAAREGLATAH